MRDRQMGRSMRGRMEERRAMLPYLASLLTTSVLSQLDAKRPRNTRLLFPSKCIFAK